MKEEYSMNKEDVVYSIDRTNFNNGYNSAKNLKCPNCSKIFDSIKRERTCSFKCKIINGMVKNELNSYASDCWFYKTTFLTEHIRISWNGEWSNTRRAAYKALKGEIPKKRRVYVDCGIKNCINPDHLFLSSKPYNQRIDIPKDIPTQKLPPIYKQIMSNIIQSGKNFLGFLLGKVRG